MPAEPGEDRHLGAVRKLRESAGRGQLADERSGRKDEDPRQEREVVRAREAAARKAERREPAGELQRRRQQDGKRADAEEALRHAPRQEVQREADGDGDPRKRYRSAVFFSSPYRIMQTARKCRTPNVIMSSGKKGRSRA